MSVPSISGELRFDQFCIAFEAALSKGSFVFDLEQFKRFNATDRDRATYELARLALESPFPIHFKKLSALSQLHDHSTFIDKAVADHAAIAQENKNDALQKSFVIPEDLNDRYEAIEFLGEGSMGRVLRAHDKVLDRDVALKITKRRQNFERTNFLAEARTLATLDHRAIVPVYDVGTCGEGLEFIASKFISGQTLAKRMEAKGATTSEIVTWVATVAQALHAAHEQGVIHRDVKPANVLIDNEGRAWLADFGLALRIDDAAKNQGFVGTPAYMSPEQARGESHRVDGRADTYSLGLILYELLAGEPAFTLSSEHLRLDQMRRGAFAPLSQKRPDLPAAFDHICERALAPRIRDRYARTKDIARDLRAVLPHQSLTTTSRPMVALDAPIVPKGLRSFDEHDADFFLALLPGPKDLFGVPEPLRRLNRVIESTAKEAPPVFVLFGPSGSGKTSLVRAGLLPRASRKVQCRVIDASSVQDESGLRASFAEDPAGNSTSLSLSIAERKHRNQGSKEVIIIDQFEQWLRADQSKIFQDSLRDVLGQCDGHRLQVVVVVRDEDWLELSRLMQDIELPLDQNNFQLVDLFDLAHGRKVLEMLGHAYGRFPIRPQSLASSHQAFLDQAVTELAINERLTPLRIALFAELLKDEPWDINSSSQFLGLKNLGCAFLDRHVHGDGLLRHHEEALRHCLTDLLPPASKNIRTHTLRLEEIARHFNMPADSHDFQGVLHTLVHEARILTQIAQDTEHERYELTHDFLVPAIAEWNRRATTLTLRGRAQAALSERATAYLASNNRRDLPGVVLWIFVRLFYPRRLWRHDERQVMTRARRSVLLNSAALLLIVVVSLIATSLWIDRQDKRRQIREGELLLDKLLIADASALGEVRNEFLAHDPAMARSMARSRLADSQPGSQEEWRLHIVLGPQPPLTRKILVAAAHEVDIESGLAIAESLTPYTTAEETALWTTITEQRQSIEQCLRAVILLLADDRQASASSEQRWADNAPQIAFWLVDSVLKDPTLSSLRIDALRPLSKRLLDPLQDILEDPQSTSAMRAASAAVIADLGNGRPLVLVRALARSQSESFPTLFAALTRGEDNPAGPLNAALNERHDPEMRANLVLALFMVGVSAPFDALLRDSSRPDETSFLVRRAARFGVSVTDLVNRLQQDKLTTEERRNLLLMLGRFDRRRLKMDAPNIIKNLRRPSPFDEVPALRSARRWLRQQLGLIEPTTETGVAAERPDIKSGPRGVYRFAGFDFITLATEGRYAMGSPLEEADRQFDEEVHAVSIRPLYALSSTEVTVAQYREFAPTYFHSQSFRSPTDDCPVLRIDWHEAARYCNRLSERAGISREQWCYCKDPKDPHGHRMRGVVNATQREGYRLPTEAEWEFACRSFRSTSRPWGADNRLLDDFAWGNFNSKERSWPVATRCPNPFGFFDMIGNAMEWCHSSYDPAEPQESERPVSRAIRGGSYYNQPSLLRTADRVQQLDTYRSESIGFRIARTLR